MKAGLDGPGRTIEVPEPAKPGRTTTPEPTPEPKPIREPEKEPVPA